MNSDLMNAVSAVVTAYLARNDMDESLIPTLIREVAASLTEVGTMAGKPDHHLAEAAAFSPRRIPAVPVERSVQDDHLICLEDGTKLKILKRHLWAKYGMTIEQYKARWNLPADYPVVAPTYSRRRSDLARRSGFQPLALVG